MDDLATDVNRRAEGLKSDLDDVDGADYSGAETTWFEQQHPLLATGSVARTVIGAVMGNGFSGSCGHISKYTNGQGKGTGEKSKPSRHPQQQCGQPINRSSNPAKRGLILLNLFARLPNSDPARSGHSSSVF
jgi:hypothetical protein